MTSRRQRTRESKTCGKKVGYASEIEAQVGACRMLMTPNCEGVAMRAYLCPWCGQWHLTKKPERRS
jgi:hypothetical protein